MLVRTIIVQNIKNYLGNKMEEKNSRNFVYILSRQLTCICVEMMSSLFQLYIIFVGLFIYSTGSLLIVEDLNEGTQQHLMGHVEEISTLALQNDCQVSSNITSNIKLKKYFFKF